MKSLLAAVLGLCAFIPVFFVFMPRPQEDDPSGGACGEGWKMRALVGQGIGTWNPEQISNAVEIIAAGPDVEGVSQRDQTIAVMVAMGESSLINIDYGDWETSGHRNPDGTPTSSLGLFQQQQWWGTRDQRLDPHDASVLFYQALIRVTGRDNMEPGEVAYTVQVGGSPAYYQGFWGDAQEIMGLMTCSTDWTLPAPGPITSEYGSRVHPIYGTQLFHSGLDLAGGGCDQPIRAAYSGTVTRVGFDAGGNGTITIQHTSEISTSYLHMWEPGELVEVGQTVSAGEIIAHIGSSGQSTGCHLHFMVLINGATVDPVTFLEEHGITVS